jgi:alcohol dehydrogenase
VSDDAAMLLSDIFPTGYEIGVQYGQVKPGDTVAVVGSGPVGLAAIATTGLHGAARVVALDPDANRREVAQRVGATDAIDATGDDAVKQVLALTDGQGFDVAIEAVGVPATFQLCLDLVRPGGHVANVGVHGAPVELDLQSLWIQNIVISMGLVNTTSLPMLLRLVASGRLPAAELVTHRFDLDDIASAYDAFGRAAQTGALKVLMHR